MPFSSVTRICQAGLKVNFFKQFIVDFIIVDVSDVAETLNFTENIDIVDVFNFLNIVGVAEVLKVVIDVEISIDVFNVFWCC